MFRYSEAYPFPQITELFYTQQSLMREAFNNFVKDFAITFNGIFPRFFIFQ